MANTERFMDSAAQHTFYCVIHSMANTELFMDSAAQHTFYCVIHSMANTELFMDSAAQHPFYRVIWQTLNCLWTVLRIIHSVTVCLPSSKHVQTKVAVAKNISSDQPT